ncbi:MAG: DUF4411 family protein [Bacteroidetes bacterium]|nr:DUF4411 family protein [Bacteroidota bacterium]
MSTMAKLYCLDANVLIEAWQKYYSPALCPDYWDALNSLGDRDIIFIPELVFEEIVRTDDHLSKWLKQSKIKVHKIDEDVTRCISHIYSVDPLHKQLVDSTKNRSLDDPWVIAHAMKEKATVVTKEELVTAPNSRKVKIPNVCKNLGIRWIHDFQMIDEVGIRFSCRFEKSSF